MLEVLKEMKSEETKKKAGRFCQGRGKKEQVLEKMEPPDAVVCAEGPQAREQAGALTPQIGSVLPMAQALRAGENTPPSLLSLHLPQVSLSRCA